VCDTLVLSAVDVWNVFVFVAVSKVRAKWHNIRASFSRELRTEKEAAKSGSGKRKRSVYKYTRNLAFLRPHMRLKNMFDNFNQDTNTMVCNTITFIKYSNNRLHMAKFAYW